MLRRTRIAAQLVAAALTTVATLALTGCGASPDPAKTTPAPGGAAYPVTVGTVTLDRQPTRIISLSPTATEMLFAIGAGRQVVAVDDQSSHPVGVPTTDLSGFKPNAEAIAGRNPDLVVLSNDTNKIVDQLRQLTIPVYLAPAARTLDDTYAQLTELGTLTGQDARRVVDGMKADVEKLLRGLPPRPRKLTYYWELDPTYYSVTSKTFIGSILGLAGLESIADPADTSGAAGGYPQLSAEGVVKANPDLIFLADSRCCQQNATTVRTRPGWGGLTAVSNDRVYPLDDDIASRWGPRAVDLLRTVTEAVAKVPA